MATRALEIKTPRWAMPLLKPKRYKGAYGGRGSGKSHFFAEALLEQLLLDPSKSAVCVRESQKSLAQSVKRLLENKIESLGLGRYFEVQSTIIKSTMGRGQIIFVGMQDHTAESVKSLEAYDIAWVEEAQAVSQRSLDLLRPTIRKDGSELWFSWNPNLPTDPVDRLFRGQGVIKDAVSVKVNYTDNPWFPSVLKAEVEHDKRDPDKYQHVWLGGYLERSKARVFDHWTVEDFEPPDGTSFRFGVDWGYANDPTVLVRCFLVGRKLYVDHEAYQVGCEITELPALFSTVPEAQKYTTVADSARPETISYMRKHGYPKLIAASKGKASVDEGIEWLKSHDIVVHPRCKHTIAELQHYSYKTDKLTGDVLPVLEDTNNHVIDALRYACEAWRRVMPKGKQLGTGIVSDYDPLTPQTMRRLIVAAPEGGVVTDYNPYD